jgi:hypothetical protein
MGRWKIGIALGLLAGAAASVPAERLGPGDAVSARAVLRDVLETDRTWVKIHAAEVLIAFGEGPEVRRRFLVEAPAAATSPYRIGIWRVLASTAEAPGERAGWIGRIEREALDPAPDPRDPNRRLRAIESLCKLRVRLGGAALESMRAFAAQASPREAPLPLWSLALAREPGAPGRLADLLGSADPTARQRAAYALRWLGPRDPGVLRRLARAAGTEPPWTPAYPFLLSAAVLLDADPARSPGWRTALEHLPAGSSADARFEASQALMPSATPATLPRIARLLDDPDANIRVGAAWTLLSFLAHRSSPP